MNSFIKKDDIDIIQERIELLSVKMKLNRKLGETFLKYQDNLEMYVRIAYLLGEPCWGRYSPVNNPY